MTAAIEQELPRVGNKTVAMFVVGALAGFALGLPTAYALVRENSAAATAGDYARAGQLITESQEALRASQPERALASLLEAARLHPQNEVVQNNLCAALNELHHFEAAIVACNSALSLNKDFVLAKNNLAWAQGASERAKVAAAAASKP